MGDSWFTPNSSGFIPNVTDISPVYPGQITRPRCDRYGCLVPLRPLESANRILPKTKLGFDACRMPHIQRQRCPCCMYRDVPDMCCKKISKFPNPCNYEVMDMHHKRIYGRYMFRFDGACRFWNHDSSATAVCWVDIYLSVSVWNLNS